MDRREALKALMSLPATTQVSVAKVKLTDVIVLECELHLPEEHAIALKRRIQEFFPGQKVLVLGSGLKLKVFSVEQANG